jgi:N-acetylglucosaminyl-diphospho-decaprenol L-rhamnosyltransferase
MTSNPTVSVIIVSYNTRDMTCACIESVLTYGQNVDQEVIVLDNVSSDGSADAISSRFPQVELIRSNENHGFGKGNNVAAKQAKGDYLLLLNPDTLLLDNAIEKLLAFAKRRPEAKMWGGRTLRGDRTLDPQSAWTFMSLRSLFSAAVGLSAVFPNSRLFNPESIPDWDRSTEREVDMITGCLLLMKRGFWEELGGFDEKFFMYAEETDLCYRAYKLGARPTTTPTVEIIHYGGASETVRADKLVRLHSGKARFVRKHWSTAGAAAGVAAMKLHALFRFAIYGLSGRVLGKESHREAAEAWLQMWKRRGTWQDGYT